MLLNVEFSFKKGELGFKIKLVFFFRGSTDVNSFVVIKQKF